MSNEDNARAIQIMELARETLDSDEINVCHVYEDEEPELFVSEGDDNGAWVKAWVWVSFEGTQFDKGDGDNG